MHITGQTCSVCTTNVVPDTLGEGRAEYIAASNHILHTCRARDGRKLPRGKEKYAKARAFGIPRHLEGSRAGLPADFPQEFHEPAPEGCSKWASPLWDELKWFIFTARDPRRGELYAPGVFILVDEQGRDLTHLNSTEIRAYMEWTKSVFDNHAGELPGLVKEPGTKGDIWVKAPEFYAAIGTPQYPFLTRPRPVCVRHPQHPRIR